MCFLFYFPPPSKNTRTIECAQRKTEGGKWFWVLCTFSNTEYIYNNNNISFFFNIWISFFSYLVFTFFFFVVVWHNTEVSNLKVGWGGRERGSLLGGWPIGLIVSPTIDGFDEKPMNDAGKRERERLASTLLIFDFILHFLLLLLHVWKDYLPGKKQKNKSQQKEYIYTTGLSSSGFYI